MSKRKLSLLHDFRKAIHESVARYLAARRLRRVHKPAALEVLETRVLMAGDLTISPISRQFCADDQALTIHTTFTDLQPGIGYQATVNWGDNQQSAATVDAGTFTITASHQYAADGNYQPTVVLDRGQETAQRQFRAEVYNPSLVTTQELPADVNHPDLAEYLITMPGSGGTAHTYQLSVDTSSGAPIRSIVELDADGQPISGTTQTVGGVSTVPSSQGTSTQTGASGSTGAGETTTAALSIAPIARQFCADDQTLQLQASFADLYPGTSYQSTIDWGDGQQSVAVVDVSTSTISASHQYSADGVYQPMITLNRGQETAQRSFVATVFNPSLVTTTQQPADPNNPDVTEYIITMPGPDGNTDTYRLDIDHSGATPTTTMVQLDADGQPISGTTQTGNRSQQDSTQRNGMQQQGQTTNTSTTADVTPLSPDSRATVIPGTAGDDTFLVRLDADTHNNIEVFGSDDTTGDPIETLPLSQVSSLWFDTGDGDDTLIIDSSNGDPRPGGGLYLLDQSGNNTLELIGGTYDFKFDAAAMAANLTLTLTQDANQVGAQVNFWCTQHLAALNIGTGCTATLKQGADKVLILNSLTIETDAESGAPLGTLNLNDNAMIVNYGETSPFADINNYVTSGFDAWMWDGHGICSGSANYDIWYGSAIHGVAVVDNNDLGDTDFAGVHLADTDNDDYNQVIVSYAPYGDTNLDGAVDGIDVSDFLSGYYDFGVGWVHGDFSYDGYIDEVDLSLLLGGVAFAPSGHLTRTDANADLEGNALSFTSNITDGTDYAWSVTKADDTNFSATGTGDTFTFTPPDEGTYTVSLVVDAGDPISQTTDIADVAPVLSISGRPTVISGEPYALSLSSSDVGQDTISNWSINWGDGVTDNITGNPRSATHIYTDGPNTHVILAMATDENGTYGAGQAVNVTVGGSEYRNVGDSNTLLVRLDDTGSMIQVYDNAQATGDPIYSLARASTPALTLMGNGGDDTVIIDSTNGDPRPGGGIYFDNLTGSNSLTIKGGTYDFEADAAAMASNLTLTLAQDANQQGAHVNFWCTQHLAALNIGAGCTATLPQGADKVLILNSLTITEDDGVPQGTLDLNDNAMIVNYGDASPYTDINQYLTTGFDGWMWDGHGINSTVASEDVWGLGIHGVGIIDNALWGDTDFAGVHLAATDNSDYNQVLVGYALYGDTNLDGLVDSTDVSNFLMGYNDPADFHGWLYGDFSYDGYMDCTDWSLLLASMAFAPSANLTRTDANADLEGNALSFTSNITDGTTYAWSVTKDNASFDLPTGTDTASPTFTFTPPDEGTYTVSLVVDATSENPRSASQAIDIANVAPVITSLTRADTNPNDEGQELSFTAAAVDAGTSDALHYSWTVTKNGNPYSVASPDNASFSFTPDNEGTYIVRVDVVDDDGASGTMSSEQSIIDVPPTLAISGPSSVEVGQLCTLNLSSSDPGTETISHWTIDWGDRTDPDGDGLVGQVVQGNPSSVTHIYADGAGSYTITATATDQDGTYDVTSQQVTVADASPVLITGPSATGVNQEAEFTATVANPSTYAWTVTKDGSTVAQGTSSTLDYTPDAAGAYVVALTAVDGSNVTTTKSVNLTVDSCSPYGLHITDPVGNEGEGDALTFSGAAINPLSGSLAYAWTVTQNDRLLASGTGDTFNATLLHSGNYLLTMTVSNGTASSTCTQNLVISESATQVNWNGKGDGVSWNDVNNWQYLAVPTSSDDVIIDVAGGAPIVITSGDNMYVHSLICRDNLQITGGSLTIGSGGGTLYGTTTLSAGTLTNSGLLLLVGNMTWTGGTLAGSGTTQIASDATVTVSGDSTVYLDHQTVENAGNIVVTGISRIWAENGPALANSGILEFTGDGDLSSPYWANPIPPTLSSSGRILKSGGTGQSVIGWVVNSTGTIECDTGTLQMGGGGAESGSFVEDSGSRLLFSVGAYTWTNVTTSGAGLVEVGADYYEGGPDWGVTVAVEGENQLTLDGGLTLSSGTITVSQTIAVDGLLTMNGGTITGSGQLLVNGDMTWYAGTMSGDGTTEIGADSTVTTSSGWSGGYPAYPMLDHRTLENWGTIRVTGLYYYIRNGSTLVNHGTLEFTGNSFFQYGNVGTMPTLTNSGTIIKSGGTGTSYIQCLVNSTGTIDADGGTLRLTGGGTQSGNAIAVNNATLWLTSGKMYGILKPLSGTELACSWWGISNSAQAQYDVEYSEDGITYAIADDSSASGSLNNIISSLDRNTSYWVRIKSTDSNGTERIWSSAGVSTLDMPDQTGMYSVGGLTDNSGHTLPGTSLSERLMGSPASAVLMAASAYVDDGNVPVAKNGYTLWYLNDSETYSFDLGAQPQSQPHGYGADIKESTGIDSNPAVTDDPISYANGSVNYNAVDLESSALGGEFGVSRNWTNTGQIIVEDSQGNGMIDTGIPSLVQVSSLGLIGENYAGQVRLVFNSQNIITFKWQGGTYGGYVSDSTEPCSLTLDNNVWPEQLVYSDAKGDTITFNGFNNANEPGKFVSSTDAAGNETYVNAWTASGDISEIRRRGAGQSADGESWLYTYVTSGDNTGRLASVAMRTPDGQGGWITQRSVAYAYYVNADPNGSRGDLKTATVLDANNAVIGTSYYRYYKAGQANGYAHGLKYVFDAQSFARLEAAFGSNYDTAPDTTTSGVPGVDQYAKEYMEYDSSRHCTRHDIQSFGGDDSAIAGVGKFLYAYSTNPNYPANPTDAANTWMYKTIETLPDGNRNVVYCNAMGLAMLTVFQDINDVVTPDLTGKQWGTFQKFDSAGRVLWTAKASAVDLPVVTTTGLSIVECLDASLAILEGHANGQLSGIWDGCNDLLHKVNGNYEYLDDVNGEIDVTSYYSSTLATSTTASGALGYESAESIRHGETGSDILQSTYDYYAHTVGTGATASTTVVIADETTYANDDGTGAATTHYAYTWSATSNQYQELITTLPAVSTAHNGSNVATSSAVVYDAYGHPIWTRDADGFLTYMAYDLATGAVTKIIQDVNTSGTHTGRDVFDASLLPSGWSTTTGQHLVTDYVVDKFGRTTQETDPNGVITYTVYNDAGHETRVYAGWNSTTHTPTGPTTVIRVDLARNYTETLTMTATPAVDANGRPTGVEAISGVQSLSRSYRNSAGQVAEVDQYFSFTGITAYSETSYLGTSGTNYYAATYGYDANGWLDRVVEPTGTITRKGYDGLGRLTSTFIGTNDTGAAWDNGQLVGGTSNLVEVSSLVYDGTTADPHGGVGDDNVTQSNTYDGNSHTYTTSYQYDWRDRLTDSRGPDDVAVRTTYDNLDNVTETQTYIDANQDFAIDTGGLRGQTTVEYDELGRPYETDTYSVDSGTASSTAIVSKTWYDNRGDVIESSTSGQAVAKTVYDGVGRVAKQFTTDGGGGTSYAAASSVASDIVLTETDYQYDADGNVILEADKARFHDATATGELSSSDARVYYTAMYYDAIGRLAASVNVGTNGGAAYTRPSTVPSRSDTVLVTSYGYDDANRVQTVADPLGIVSKTYSDMLGRTTETIDAYTDGVATNSSNQTTFYTYDGNDDVLTVRADMPTGAVDQVTQYVYGVSPASGSTVYSNDLLAKVEYPNNSTGQAGTTADYQVSYTYDALGRTLTKTDQNGTVHSYSYDSAGRVSADAVTTFGTGVDQSVAKIGYTYDDLGRVFKTTSYDASNNVLNEIQTEYNGLGQISVQYQSDQGNVNVNSTPKVQYAYSSLADGSRLTSVTYPNGRVISYNYDTGLDSTISRLSSISDSTGTLESYEYLGDGTIVQASRPQVGDMLTYIKLSGESNGDAGDQYTGLDRFGRVVDQRWVTSSGTALDRYTYTYDGDGNRLTRANLTKTDGSLSETYTYDSLNRLTDTTRGGADYQSWNLDALGNMNSVTTGGTAVARTSNAANEITSIEDTAVPTYDADGNMLTDGSGQGYTYDAWNRMTAAYDTASGKLIAQYEYDGRGYRIAKLVALYGDTEHPSTITGYDRTDYLYNSNWQEVEERVAAGVSPANADTPATTAAYQYVWSIGYINSIICRDEVSGPNAGRRLFYTQDANYNVTALIDGTAGSATLGQVVERYSYTAYGEATVYDPYWAVRSSGSFYSNVRLFGGEPRDMETGLTYDDWRYDNTRLDVFLTRDPMMQNLNPYQYCSSNPTDLNDPSGLWDTGARVKYRMQNYMKDGKVGTLTVYDQVWGACYENEWMARGTGHSKEWSEFVPDAVQPQPGEQIKRITIVNEDAYYATGSRAKNFIKDTGGNGKIGHFMDYFGRRIGDANRKGFGYVLGIGGGSGLATGLIGMLPWAKTISILGGTQVSSLTTVVWQALGSAGGTGGAVFGDVSQTLWLGRGGGAGLYTCIGVGLAEAGVEVWAAADYFTSGESKNAPDSWFGDE